MSRSGGGGGSVNTRSVNARGARRPRSARSGGDLCDGVRCHPLESYGDTVRRMLAQDHRGPGRLRELLAGTEPVVAPGAYDALSARLVAQAGFDAVYMTGFGASASLLGQPDVGLLSFAEMADQARRLAEAVDVPLIADADDGYGNPINVARTVRAYEAAGVAGLHLEDQLSPKRCGHLEGKQLIAASEMVEKVHAAVEARRSAGPGHHRAHRRACGRGPRRRARARPALPRRRRRRPLRRGARERGRGRGGGAGVPGHAAAVQRRRRRPHAAARAPAPARARLPARPVPADRPARGDRGGPAGAGGPAAQREAARRRRAVLPGLHRPRRAAGDRSASKPVTRPRPDRRPRHRVPCPCGQGGSSSSPRSQRAHARVPTLTTRPRRSARRSGRQAIGVQLTAAARPGAGGARATARACRSWSRSSRGCACGSSDSPRRRSPSPAAADRPRGGTTGSTPPG